MNKEMMMTHSSFSYVTADDTKTLVWTKSKDITIFLKPQDPDLVLKDNLYGTE